jgi:hypothetical protein
MNEKRLYSGLQAYNIANGIVICDMAQAGKCDGKPCFFMHNKPHKFIDIECFSECCHEGKTGLCVPAIGKVETYKP